MAKINLNRDYLGPSSLGPLLPATNHTGFPPPAPTTHLPHLLQVDKYLWNLPCFGNCSQHFMYNRSINYYHPL